MAGQASENPGRPSTLIAIVAVIAMAAGCSDAPSPGSSGAAAPPDRAPAAGPGEMATDTAIAAVERYLADDDLASAETIAARLVEQRPDDSRAREVLGRVLLSRALAARPPAASAWYERAYEQYAAAAEAAASGPDAAPLHHGAGTLAVQIGRPDAALEHYLRAARIDPLDPRAPLFAAQLLIERDRLDEAAAHLDRVLAIDPDLPQAHASKAIIAIRREAYEQALADVAVARGLDPGDLGIRVIEARILRRGGDARAALTLLVPLPADTRAAAEVTAEIAAAWSALDEHDRAAKAWMHRHRGRPNDPEIWRAAIEAASALLLAGRRNEAASWLEEARAAAPDAPELHAVEQAIREGG